MTYCHILTLYGTDATEAARATASGLIVSVGAPYDLMTGRAEVGVSVGAALVEETCTRDELVNRADQALYQAKRAGRGTFRAFASQLEVSPDQPQRRTAPLVSWVAIELS